MSDTYWMVERNINGRAHWWMRPPINHEHWNSPHRWTTNSALAVHFPAREAAELVAANDMCECFVSEHMDIVGAEVQPQKPDWDAASEAMRWLNDIEAMQGGKSGPTIKLRAAIKAMQTEAANALYMVRADKAQTLMEAEKAMAQIREATAKFVRERDEARADLAAALAEVERLTAANQMHREAAMQIAKDAEAEAAALRDAIDQSIMYLGPVAPSCCGCEYEWNCAIEALNAAINQARGGGK